MLLNRGAAGSLSLGFVWLPISVPENKVPTHGILHRTFRAPTSLTHAWFLALTVGAG